MGGASSRVEGKTVLLTGASRGIGLATATLLAKDGWIVFAGVRKQEDFDKLQALHANIRPVILDVTKPEQVASAIETVRVAVGESGLDALVNNAGGSHMAPLEFFPPEDFEQEFELNVIGVFRVSQAAIPLLRARTPGRIINVSSLVGRAPLPMSGAYCAAKHALEAFSSILRQELKSSGIQVSVLGPGPVKTHFAENVREKYAEVTAKVGNNLVYEQKYSKRMLDALDLQASSQNFAMTSERLAEQIRYLLLTSWLRHRYADSYLTWIMTNVYTWLPYWVTERMTALLFY